MHYALIHFLCIYASTWYLLGDPEVYRKYILQIPQPSPYSYAKLRYRFAVTSGSPRILYGSSGHVAYMCGLRKIVCKLVYFHTWNFMHMNELSRKMIHLKSVRILCIYASTWYLYHVVAQDTLRTCVDCEKVSLQNLLPW